MRIAVGGIEHETCGFAAPSPNTEATTLLSVARTLRAADVMVVERTYPHIDMAERAIHAVRMMHRTITGEVRPTMAVRYLPLLWSAARMIDAEPPMSDALTVLRDLDQRDDVLSASIGVGYQWIDNPTVGTSVIVVTDNNEELARRYADELVVISERHQPVDLAFCRSLGLDCRQMRYLAVKSTGHFRSGFAPIAGSIFNVDTASTLSHDFRRLPYTRLGRRIYPIDSDVEWRPGSGIPALKVFEPDSSFE